MCILSLENIQAKSIHSQFSERIEHSCPELAWCDFCCIRSLLGTAKAHAAKFAGQTLEDCGYRVTWRPSAVYRVQDSHQCLFAPLQKLVSIGSATPSTCLKRSVFEHPRKDRLSTHGCLTRGVITFCISTGGWKATGLRVLYLPRALQLPWK
jgi:hypothetical protein